MNLTGLTAGTEAETAESIIRKHLSQAVHGPGVDGIVAALAWGDDVNWQNAILAFDQLFRSTAAGKYLDRLGANQGVRRPDGLGIEDDLFRVLLIKLSTNKITHQALREILEVFYGQDALRAYAETSLEEPFALSSGLDLEWKLDENQDFRVEFSPADFTVMSSARGIEIAAVLTKVMRDAGSNGFAVALVDSETGGTRVRIYSGSLGLKSSVRIVGGRALPFLRLDTYDEVYSGPVTSGLGYVWVYGTPQPNVTSLSLTTTGLPLIDVSSIEGGDYLVIGSGVGSVPPGTYYIRSITTQWSGPNLTQTVELDADLAFVGSVTQSSNDNYRFFSPTKRTTLNGSRTVVVAQVAPNQVDIQIPATTEAVNRTVFTGAYPKADSSPAPDGNPGPYIFDVNDGLAVTAVQVSLASPILKSQHYDRIQVSSTADFPDTGFIVLGFGRYLQSRPIKYLAKVGTDQLLIDFSHTMEFDYDIGCTVDYISSRAPWVPSDPTESGNFYLTGSSVGRLAAQTTVEAASAAGITLDFTVIYPGDRGLGGEGFPTEGPGKLSDIVTVFGGDE